MPRLKPTEQADVGIFGATIVYGDDAFAEPLSEAVRLAGGQVVHALHWGEVERPEDIQEPVLVLNLEPVTARHDAIFDALLDEYDGRLVINDGSASRALTGPERARWIRTLSGKIAGEIRDFPVAPIAAPPSRPDAPAGVVSHQLWVFAASIGGPEALRSFVARLQSAPPFPMILAQHIGPDFSDLMVRQLAKAGAVEVRLIESGARLEPGCLWVMPAASELRIADDFTATLIDSPPDRRFTPCIDQVIEAALGVADTRTHVIVFSGMASDGVAGAAEAMARGGEVWVQEPSSCVVSSMVSGALECGGVQRVGLPEELAEHLNRWAREEENQQGD